MLDRPPDDYARERGRPLPREEYSRYIGPLDDDLAQRRDEYARQRMREDYGRPFPREGYRDPDGRDYRRDPRDAPPGRDDIPPPYRDWDRSREMHGDPRSRDIRVVSDRAGPGPYGERRMSPPREWPRVADGAQGGLQEPREAPPTGGGGETAHASEGDRRPDEVGQKGIESTGR